MSADESLDTCGACEGIQFATPVDVTNPPGLPQLAWRVGTQARFKESLLAAISATPSLRSLTTRADDDPSIALLDAWACSLDVLTFYQERIANENYLRTATELNSVLQLARAIGYELRPGVGASAKLAFTIESQTIPGALPAATIPAGAKIQSIPGQNEKPQLFETSIELYGRAAWNSMPARTSGSIIPSLGQPVVYLQGVSTGLQPGDAILIVGDERKKWAGSENWDFRRVQSITLNIGPTPATSSTAVTLDRPLGKQSRGIDPAQKNPRVFGLRRRTSLFGASALDPRLLNKKTAQNLDVKHAGKPNAAWRHFNTSYSSTPSDTTIYLDGAQPAAVAGSWIVLVAGNYEEVYSITDAEESALTVFGLSGKATKLTLAGENLATVYGNKLIETSVFIQTDELVLAAVPITTAVAANSFNIEVSSVLSGDDALPPGRELIFTDGVQTEPVTLAKATPSKDGAGTLLQLNEKLQNTYARAKLRVLGNVVDATQGETRLLPIPGTLPLPGASVSTAGFAALPRTEVLGSGDASKVFQTFTLKQVPLTFVSSANASGGTSTLQVRVDNILWKEVPTLYGHGPKERIYVTRIADNGAVTIKFGDGKTGARLPTGQENIEALYRVGGGIEGNVRAGQLSMLLTRPLGVKDATNPEPASGGADGQRWSDARVNAPLTVLTLDRVVSLLDCENFARAFSGVGKAAAVLVWDGETQIVHLTVAAVDGAALEPGSDPYLHLMGALDAARHPERPIILQTFSPRPFHVAAEIAVDPDHDAKAVIAAVAQKLAADFSFANRAFAQAVTASDIYTSAQNVPGVVAVDLNQLNFVGDAGQLRQRLPARSAWLDGAGLHAAELLTLEPTDLVLSEMSA